ncbi:hypothetical protein [Miniimonas sp. S16]|uniref:hypothetical protein n=1 Tax=Miniimonas sp. S16 TaxID=2171623 RepID=UPI00131F18CA|nr:hypothetical protein [Miniimonas sp. S16]
MTADSVTIWWVSGDFVGEPPADADEPRWTWSSNPIVERTVVLAEPLGGRAVLDASNWPPRDVRGVSLG